MPVFSYIGHTLGELLEKPTNDGKYSAFYTDDDVCRKKNVLRRKMILTLYLL